MSQIVIGKADGKNVSLGLDVLLRTRLLIQANSGKGKSWPLQKVRAPDADPKAIDRAIERAVRQVEARREADRRESVIALKQLQRDAGRAQALIFDIEKTLREAIEDLSKVSGVEIQKGEPNRLALAAGGDLDKRRDHPRPMLSKVPSDGDVNLKAGARKMLAILAQWHPDPKTRDELGALAGFSPSGGTFGEYLSKLRTGALVHENGNGLSITDDGLMLVGTIPDRPDSTEELVGMWKSKFKAGIGRMLDVLVEAHPHEMKREELGERSGFAASGGTFGEYLSALRRARLIEESGGQVKAAESLFP